MVTDSVGSGEKDKEKLEITLAFDPYKQGTKIDLGEVEKYVESVTDFQSIPNNRDWCTDFLSKDEKEELVIHSNGMFYLGRIIEDVKTDIPTLINNGYELIRKLKEIDLNYQKGLGIMFKGKNALKVYKEERERLKESIEKILGGTEMKETYLSDTFSRVDYSPSEVF